MCTIRKIGTRFTMTSKPPSDVEVLGTAFPTTTAKSGAGIFTTSMHKPSETIDVRFEEPAGGHSWKDGFNQDIFCHISNEHLPRRVWQG